MIMGAAQAWLLSARPTQPGAQENVPRKEECAVGPGLQTASTGTPRGTLRPRAPRLCALSLSLPLFLSVSLSLSLCLSIWTLLVAFSVVFVHVYRFAGVLYVKGMSA